jgi:hypothetical protein
MRMVVEFPVAASARARLRRRANPSTAAARKPRQRSERELEWFRTFGPRLRATRLGRVHRRPLTASKAQDLLASKPFCEDQGGGKRRSIPER